MEDLSRRALLQAIAASLAGAAVPAGWADAVLSAATSTSVAAVTTADAPKLSFFTAVEAADVEAVAAQIIPTDDTPGAREAGVIIFIDRALSTLMPQLAGDYRTHFAAFQAAFRKQLPAGDTASFASLPADRQIAFLKTVDRTPFFETTRLLTLFGMFSLPKYGGNRDGVGWKLLGFEDQHAFYPPFGYYDRDYPGFTVDTGKTK